MAVLVCTTDKLPRTVFISDALMTNLVWATDAISEAAFLLVAGEFADALTSVGTGIFAVECFIEVEPFVCKKAVRREC